jgi:hypothetical protein
MTTLLPLSVLKRLLDAAPEHAPGSACRRCGRALSEDHQHIADIDTRTLECACEACHAVAMASGDVSAPRPVPRRYIRLPDAAVTEEQWDMLGIPVGIAFFFQNSSLGRSVVSYPSPAGATESLLSPDSRERVLHANPWMCGIMPDVEALLVRRTHEAHECFIVPIDACYELAGRIRRRWSGFGGGPEVRTEIESFFTMLRAKSEPAIP